nr:hypothetical protein GCM10020093_078470 [Planobispora longispora]
MGCPGDHRADRIRTGRRGSRHRADGAPDPAHAIKRQLRSEHGVRISETNRYFFGRKSAVSGSGTRINGRLQLAPSGPAAADFTWRTLPRRAARGSRPRSPSPTA